MNFGYAQQDPLSRLNGILSQLAVQYPDKVREHCTYAIRQYNRLSPMMAQIPQANGSVVNGIALEGLFPINYRGSAYNIPITVYLDPAFPVVVPRICITIKNRSAMFIMPDHPVVDIAGNVINLRYLRGWRDGVQLVHVLNEMGTEFSRTPPVSANTPPASVQARINAAWDAFRSGCSIQQQNSQAQPRDARAVLEQKYVAEVRSRIEKMSAELKTAIQAYDVAFERTTATEARVASLIAEKNSAAQAARTEEAAANDAEARLAALRVERDARASISDDERLAAAMRDPGRHAAAERDAHEFALRALTEKLGSRQLSTDDFLQTVRGGAREQFRAILTHDKIRRSSATQSEAGGQSTPQPSVTPQMPPPPQQQPYGYPPRQQGAPVPVPPRPQGYAPPSQGYAPPPQGYAPPPQAGSYAQPPRRNSYAQPPQGYAQQPGYPPQPGYPQHPGYPQQPPGYTPVGYGAPPGARAPRRSGGTVTF